jgi:hypothetical protein
MSEDRQARRPSGRAQPVSCLSVTLPTGRIGARTATWHRAVLGLALTAAIALAAGGCASAAASAQTATSGNHGLLTLAQAHAAYNSYVTASNMAAAHADKTQGLAVVGDAQWADVESQYTALATSATPVPRYRYVKPVFYVPTFTSYPEWFVVAVRRTPRAGGPTVNVLMGFQRNQAGGPWTMDGSAVLDRPLPTIARQSDGYAVPLATSDTGLLVRPDVIGATQAAVVDEGPANPAAALIGSGPASTGFYAGQAAQAAADAARRLQYQWLLEGTSFPVFVLRTADGAALVLYGMYLSTSTQHPNLARGSPIPVPADAASQFPRPHEVAYHALWANWTYEYAAIDPPPTVRNAKLEIIGADAALTYAHAV